MWEAREPRLFNWLFARHNQGTFSVGIEDTDKSRERDEAVQAIYEGCAGSGWIGMRGRELRRQFMVLIFKVSETDLREVLDLLKAKGVVYEDAGAFVSGHIGNL